MTTSTDGSNCVVLLIDESAAMSAVMRDKLPDGSLSTKTNAERVATSINNLIRQLANGPSCQVTVIGYRTDEAGQADVGCRWPTGAAGTEFLQSSDLNEFAVIEQRTKKVPRPDGSLDEVSIDFPVWYTPVVKGKAPQIAAFKYTADLLKRWAAGHAAENCGQPIVIHIFSGTSGDGNPQMAIQDLLRLNLCGKNPLVAQCHMASASALVTSAFPSKQAFLPAGLARDLFSRGSEIPSAMYESLKALRVNVLPGGRAVVHNAKMADLFCCLELAKCHVAGDKTKSEKTKGSTPQNQGGGSNGAEPETQPDPHESTGEEQRENGAECSSATHDGEQAGLLVLILDRSVADPFDGNLKNPCNRLQEAANEILKELSSKQSAEMAIDTAILSYGNGSDGQPEIRNTFDGPLTGQTVVRNSELPDNAIRVEESETEIPNGVGGLITVKKKTPIYFDIEPTLSTSPQPAFAAAAAVAQEWCSQHPTALPPIALHLTRGEHSPDQVESAAGLLSEISTSAGTCLLHHLVLTEQPQKSVAYPPSESDCESEELKSLWRTASPVMAWEFLADKKGPHITQESRGFVVNGKFDVLAKEFSHALSAE